MSDTDFLGIICLDTTFDKIPGHIRNQVTFDFPIRLKVVKGATPARLIEQADPALLQPLIDAALELQAEGARAIAGSCGFLVLFQQEIAAALNVPYFSSSLLQLPMLHQMLGRKRRIGIMVANAPAFGQRHLAAIGAEEIPTAVIGMQDQPEFSEAILQGKRDALNVARLRDEVLGQARALVAQHPDLAAIVLECTDLPPFAADIQRETGLPVFDAITLARMAWHGFAQQPYA